MGRLFGELQQVLGQTPGRGWMSVLVGCRRPADVILWNLPKSGAEGQTDLDFQATLRPVACLNRSSVNLDGPARDAQAQANAPRLATARGLGPIERLKQMRQAFLTNSRTVISN